MCAKQGEKKTVKQDISQPDKQTSSTLILLSSLPRYQHAGGFACKTVQCYLIDPKRLELHGLAFEEKI